MNTLKNKIPIFLLTLIALLFPLNASAENIQKEHEERAEINNKQMIAYADKKELQGYSLLGHYNALLEDSSTQRTESFNLMKGKRYEILGVCDHFCHDLDLQLSDVGEKVTRKDDSASDLPHIAIAPNVNEAYYISIKMNYCEKSPCGAVVAIFETDR